MEYPDSRDLKFIENYKLNTYQSYRGFADFVVATWNNHYGRATLGRKILRLVTGGWSGNEDIISAICRNRIFGMTCWQQSKRGGLHIYELPNKKCFK